MILVKQNPDYKQKLDSNRTFKSSIFSRFLPFIFRFEPNVVFRKVVGRLAPNSRLYCQIYGLATHRDRDAVYKVNPGSYNIRVYRVEILFQINFQEHIIDGLIMIK
ncbi:MAG: hypothetical protein K9H61_09855 [Bacteroidia bacterium]|nr:hypothetical protein [Bacteroidia bacterium]MCF8427416.1 hypothetical protein [Bacteroidia bacterium]MCF8447286.1 hypothetical protein [Bacteroidia bacterium]